MTGAWVAVAPVHPAAGDAAWADWLTPAELGYAAGRRRAGEHLAARRLAKQAVLRAIGWTGPPPWADLQVIRGGSGAPRLALGGDLARWLATRGFPAPGVSLSHAAGYAAGLAWLPAGGSVASPSGVPSGVPSGALSGDRGR